METEEGTNGHTKPERKTARKFTDDEKHAILAELDKCQTSAEVKAVRAKHQVQLSQTNKWREKLSGKPAAKGKPSRKLKPVPIERPAVGAVDLARYLQSLEERIEELEAFRAGFRKAVGGE